MNVFKLKPGSDEKILISQENFEKYTGKEFPYCVDHGFNRKSYYAVCPACDNPIQFVGLYQKTSDVKGKKDAYGRHHKGDIPKLAKYDEIAYLNCPLSNRNYKQDNAKRSEMSITAKGIWNTLYDEYDRIVYIFEQSTGIKISNSFAENLLKLYIKDKSWLNYESTYQNLSFMLLYANPAYSLINRKIYKNCNLYNSLNNIEGDFILEETNNDNLVKITPTSQQYIKLSFILANHESELRDNELIETFDLKVHYNNDLVHHETITVDQLKLTYLKNIPKAIADKYRNKALMEKVHKIMKEKYQL